MTDGLAEETHFIQILQLNDFRIHKLSSLATWLDQAGQFTRHLDKWVVHKLCGYADLEIS